MSLFQSYYGCHKLLLQSLETPLVKLNSFFHLGWVMLPEFDDDPFLDFHVFEKTIIWEHYGQLLQ